MLMAAIARPLSTYISSSSFFAIQFSKNYTFCYFMLKAADFFACEFLSYCY
jgi:hypothetical protein